MGPVLEASLGPDCAARWAGAALLSGDGIGPERNRVFAMPNPLG